MKCVNCGWEYPDNSNYCPTCGRRITTMRPGSHWVPIAIMVLLSFLGIWAFFALG